MSQSPFYAFKPAASYRPALEFSHNLPARACSRMFAHARARVAILSSRSRTAMIESPSSKASRAPTGQPPRRILVVQPSWVGDAVMATPTLRAIRRLFPDAHISYLLRRYVKPIYAGMPWADKLVTYRTGKTKAKAGKGQFFDLAARLRRRKFDLAILLPNSFKSALVCKMAGIDRIIGYERDGRGFLLRDELLPVKDKGKFVPSPMVKYYLGLAHYLGSTERDLTLQLFVTPTEKRDAESVLKRAGLDALSAHPDA